MVAADKVVQDFDRGKAGTVSLSELLFWGSLLPWEPYTLPTHSDMHFDLEMRTVQNQMTDIKQMQKNKIKTKIKRKKNKNKQK